MAKIAYSKLKCKVNDSVATIKIDDEISIEVKQYLPVQEKLQLIGRVVEFAHEQDANYSNPVKASVYRDIEVVFAYTNISFTEKQKEDVAKLYDQLSSSGLLEKIITAIPKDEYDYLCSGVWQSIDAIYAYQNSILGILDNVRKEQNSIQFDLDKAVGAIQDPQTMTFLKQVLTELG